MTRIFVLNEPYALRISPALAQEIGFSESIVLLQLEFLITISKTKEIDGNIWTYQSLADLKNNYFPFWSIATISRIIKRLEKEGYIKIGNYNKLGYDRTQWYSLNEEGIAKLNSIYIDKSILQNEKWNRAKCKMEPRKMQNGTAQNETTIPETPTETPTETPPEEDPPFPFKTADPTPIIITSAADKRKSIIERILFPILPAAVEYFPTITGAADTHGEAETEQALRLAFADWKLSKGSNGNTYNPHNYGWIEWGITLLTTGKKTWKDPNGRTKKPTPEYTQADRDYAARIIEKQQAAS